MKRAPLLLLVAALACRTATTVDRPWPDTVAQATDLRGRGVEWSNGEVREHYHRLVGRIAVLDGEWRKQGSSAEERARRAFATRRDARLTTRAMMKDAAEVEALRRRDVDKYGNPDGPTFEYLVAKERAKGLDGPALFEAIVASAQRTAESGP